MGWNFGCFIIAHLFDSAYAVAIPNSITNPMIPGYLLAIISFILLALHKPVAIVLLFISAVYAAINEYLWMSNYAFSLVVLLLFVFHIIILVAKFLSKFHND
jgi:predicted ferric reductase